MARKYPLVKWRCDSCGSEEVGHDAASVWDVDAQEEVLGSAYDDDWCTNCGDSARIVDIPLTRAEITERRARLAATPQVRALAALKEADGLLALVLDDCAGEKWQFMRSIRAYRTKVRKIRKELVQ